MIIFHEFVVCSGVVSCFCAINLPVCVVFEVCFGVIITCVVCFGVSLLMLRVLVLSLQCILAWSFI